MTGWLGFGNHAHASLAVTMDAPGRVAYKGGTFVTARTRRVSPQPQPATLVPVEADLSRISEAAWIIDLDLVRIIAASPAGRSLWNGAWREGISFDTGMPALAEFNRSFHALSGGESAEQERMLLIWTAAGAFRLRCRCQPMAGPGRRILVTAVETAGLGPAANAPDTNDGGRATLAHELRTPLSAIVALAEVMKEERLGSMGNARYLVYANDIYESARHALSVLEAMLEAGAGGRTAQETAATDVNETVSRCLSALRALADRAGVRLQAQLDSNSQQIVIERRSLMQILLNLLSNALKFTPKGGAVTVETLCKAEGGLVLSVRDTGPGIAADELERIKAGQQLSAAGAGLGSGYGLPLVRALARTVGASVEIDSAPEQGTRVSLTFPRHRVVEAGSISD